MDVTCLVSVPLTEFSMFTRVVGATKVGKERFVVEWGQGGSLIVRNSNCSRHSLRHGKMSAKVISFL